MKDINNNDVQIEKILKDIYQNTLILTNLSISLEKFLYKWEDEYNTSKQYPLTEMKNTVCNTESFLKSVYKDISKISLKLCKYNQQQNVSNNQTIGDD